MAVAVFRLRLKAALLNFERNAAVLSNNNVQNMELKKLIHTPQCNGSYCKLPKKCYNSDVTKRHDDVTSTARRYSRHHGRAQEGRQADSGSDSDSDTECKGLERRTPITKATFYEKNLTKPEDDVKEHITAMQYSVLYKIIKTDFWRRKMRTVHNILDVDKDGLVSFNDFLLFAERFKSLGHLDEAHYKELVSIMKVTWEEQYGAVDPYNLITIEQYLEDMSHVLNDKSLKKKACRWLPYLFKAVDKDKSGYISVKEFKLFYKCLGLDSDHAAVAFAAIDINGDGQLSMKEFVNLGKEFFFTNDEKRVSKMFWGPLTD